MNPRPVHVYPIDGNGKSTHNPEIGTGCFCKPEERQVCTESHWDDTIRNYKCEPGCWRCGGEIVVEVFDRSQGGLIIVHRDGQDLCYKKDMQMTIIDDRMRAANDDEDAKPHKCPVCTGRGEMPVEFYTPGVSASGGAAKCRTCNGEGIVWG